MDINAVVAKNLRALRESRNLSLEQAARITGVSKSMLGQIERDEAVPTITVLWKIAEGFKVSFTALASENSEQASVIKGADITPLAGDGGRFLNYPVFPFTEGRPFEVYRITIKPGGKLDAEPHSTNSEEYITVFSGNAVISAGNEEYSLVPGDSLRFGAGVPHSYANPGDCDVHLSMIINYL